MSRQLFATARLVLWLATATAFVEHGVAAPDELNFAHADVPLHEQVLERIREKIAAKLGKERLTHDRYFIVPFAYQNPGNNPESSHSFMAAIRVFPEGAALTKGTEFKRGVHGGWNYEACNISWLPADFLENPDLCVFHGLGARLFPSRNECPVSPGKDFNLEQTLGLAEKDGLAVGMWGPYEIKKEGFELVVKRKQLLASGQIKYRADDRLTRPNHSAINCFHALASIDEPFPNGGAFGTGFKMWGLNGTRRVLIEYTTRAKRKGLLLDPVDPKHDVYGFVYEPAPHNARGIYNPFPAASVYRR